MKKYIFYILIFFVCISGLYLPESVSAKDGVRKIFVLRHGQRPPKADPFLFPLGVRQASLAAERMKADGFDPDNCSIYASPYLRTVETAAAAARLFNKKIILNPLIQERTKHVGTPQAKGHTQAEIEAYFPGLIAPEPALKYPWVYDDNAGKILEKRIVRALDDALKNGDGDIAMFTHKTPFNVLLQELCRRAGVKIDVQIWNCSMAYFIVDSKGNTHFVGIGTGYIPVDEITNNEKTPLDGGARN